MTAPRFTTNARPMDYRSGIRPMERPSVWRGQFRPMLGLALLCAATLAAAALLLHALDPAVSPASPDAGAHSSRAVETDAGLGDG